MLSDWLHWTHGHVAAWTVDCVGTVVWSCIATAAATAVVHWRSVHIAAAGAERRRSEGGCVVWAWVLGVWRHVGCIAIVRRWTTADWKDLWRVICCKGHRCAMVEYRWVVVAVVLVKSAIGVVNWALIGALIVRVGEGDWAAVLMVMSGSSAHCITLCLNAKGNAIHEELS